MLSRGWTNKLGACLWACIILVAVWGCASCECAYTGPAPLPKPSTTVTEAERDPVELNCLSRDLLPGAGYWIAETSRRYETFVLVLVHGEDVDGVWTAFPDAGSPVSVETLVERVRRDWPRRQIVLIVCNPGGHDLAVPGVAYSCQMVWLIPTRYTSTLGLKLREQSGIRATGCIDDFVETQWVE